MKREAEEEWGGNDFRSPDHGAAAEPNGFRRGLMGSVIYRCPTKAVNVQVWFDEPTNDRETYISIRCPACARVHLVNPVTGKTPANG